MEIGFLIGSIVKIAAVLGWLYALLQVMNSASKWVRILGIVVAFGIIQLALSLKIGNSAILNDFDAGLLFQACTMAMVSLGLNLIYGFNGQFSLGQWGFYGIGAYAAAYCTYKWTNDHSAAALFVLLLFVILAGLVIVGLQRYLKRYTGIPVLSAFTLYLIGTIVAGAVALLAGNAISVVLQPLFGTPEAPGLLASDVTLQVVYFISVLCAGAFAAIVSFLFGLPVLSLGSDYFGIATLGFTIVINTLMVNSDTILPFPEMKGGRGMIGIPKVTTWFWAFFFMLLVIIVMRNLIRSSTGRAIMSVREDETASKAMGIDVANNKLLTFMVGSLFAGIAGGVYAHYIGFLSPGTFSFLAGFNPLIVIVFGGLGSMTGTIAAAFGWMFFLEGLLRVLLGQLGTEAPTWRFVLYPIALLLLMLIRPQGLLGKTEWGILKAPLVKPRAPADTQASPSAVTAGK